MNHANVAALKAALLAAFDAPDHRFLDLIAERLAARGVLAVAALTDADCAAVRETSTERYEGFLLEAEMRAALERIARGEPA